MCIFMFHIQYILESMATFLVSTSFASFVFFFWSTCSKSGSSKLWFLDLKFDSIRPAGILWCHPSYLWPGQWGQDNAGPFIGLTLTVSLLWWMLVFFCLFLQYDNNGLKCFLHFPTFIYIEKSVPVVVFLWLFYFAFNLLYWELT